MSEKKKEPCEICPVYQLILRIHESEAAQHIHNAEKELLLAAHAFIRDEIKQKGKSRKIDIEWD